MADSHGDASLGLHFVQQLLKLDPVSLRSTVGANELRRLISHLNTGVVLEDDLRETNGAQIWIAANPCLGCPELMSKILSFADVRVLGRLQAVNHMWMARVGEAKVWIPLVMNRWPGTCALQDVNLANGDFKKLYRDRFMLEPRRACTPPFFFDCNQPLLSTEEQLRQHQRELDEYYVSYALLVELSDSAGPIFNEIFQDLRLVEIGHDCEVIEGLLPASSSFNRDVEMYHVDLLLSLTVILPSAGQPGYKYLCHRARLCAEHLEEASCRTLVFSFPAFTRGTKSVRESFSSPHLYKFELGKLHRVQYVDEDIVASGLLGVTGLRRVRLWCEDCIRPHDSEDYSGYPPVSPAKIGRLKKLWDDL